MQLTSVQLMELFAEAASRFQRQLSESYKIGKLEEFLKSRDMADLLPRSGVFETLRNGKILIIGASEIKLEHIYGCIKSVGISKDRIETILEYDLIQKYEFRKLQYNPNYRLILFGPLPHSGKGKEESSSILSKIESTDGYPKLVRLIANNALKITKQSLKDALIEEIRSGYLERSEYH